MELLLSLYKKLYKIKNSILTQIRFGKIKFKNFLSDIKIPEINSFLYLCGYSREDAKYITVFCFLKKATNGDKEKLKINGYISFG